MAAKEPKSKLEKKLTMRKKPIWDGITDAQRKAAYKFAEGYKDFMTTAKTEREAVLEIIRRAEASGFKPMNKVKKAKPGDKLYVLNRNKNVAVIIVGKEPVENGLNIVAAHIDSPRLDLKQNPLYQEKETELALFKTHYYGGIKKYQWVNIPLAIHGRVVLADGKHVDVSIGEDPEDTVFTICDLLPHLYRSSQAKRRLPEGIKGEELNVLVGSMPVNDDKAKTKVKLWVLDYLNKQYGMVEEDFTSAELEIVPAGPARDVGFDRSMVGCYGQDDRICGYTTMMAIFDVKNPRRTCMGLFFDKEEIGSDGNTSVQSRFVEYVMGELLEKVDREAKHTALHRALTNSKALSSDVNGAVNPTYKDVHEMMNASRMGHGVVLTKYTGSGGKYGANDAHAEFVGEVRLMFNKAKLPWQFGELGKVDEGGGGTVAKFLAKYNMDVLDAGPALLSMHSPFEVSSKLDVYYTYKAYKVFFEKA